MFRIFSHRRVMDHGRLHSRRHFSESTLELNPKQCSTVTRVSVEHVAELLDQKSRDFVIIDVREGDFNGGHIKNALHFDYWDFAKNKPELVKNLASAAHQSDVALIFHCMNSKTRGPQCAMTIATCLVENFPAYKCKVCVMDGGFRHFRDTYGRTKRDQYFEDLHPDPKYWF